MNTEKKPRLSWRRQPREKGLAGVIQGERGWQLRCGDRTIIHVQATSGGFAERSVKGWFWSGGDDALGVPRMNTGQHPAPTADEAKAQAMQHVKAHMKRPNGA